MKVKTILLGFACMIFATGLHAQEVAEVQKSLITKRTATWCPHCGTWGWDFFASLQANVADQSVLVAAHFGGSTLQNGVSEDWVDNLGGSSQPRFFVNNEIQSVSSGNLASALTVVKDKVEGIAAQQPVANVGMQTSWSGNDLLVQTKTRFFQNGNGAYYLGVYMVEDEVLAIQTGQSGTPAHSRVLRGSVTGGAFGELLADGSIASGTDYDKTYTVDPSAYAIDHLNLVGVIWKKEGSKYFVVNVWEIDAKPVVASVDESGTLAGAIVLHPNPSAGGDVTLSIRMDEAEECEIILWNALGQQTERIFSGHLAAGTHSLRIPGGQMKTAGVYIVQIQTAGGASLSIPLSILP